VVLASYLCTVANEFICNHRDRKGMNMFIPLASAIWDQRQMSFILL